MIINNDNVEMMTMSTETVTDNTCGRGDTGCTPASFVSRKRLSDLDHLRACCPPTKLYDGTMVVVVIARPHTDIATTIKIEAIDLLRY